MQHNDHKFAKACTVIQCQAIGMMTLKLCWEIHS